jgi:type I restriction enzyme, S subunit
MSVPAYESYKDSEVAWLGEVPSHWELVEVSHLFESLDYKRVPLSGEHRSGIEKIYPYYGASGVIDYVDGYIFDEPLILVAEDGANLLSRSSPLAFIASGQYWVNNHAHILKPIDGDLQYWEAVLQVYDYTPIVTGAAQPKLTADQLGSIRLPKPPLDEQEAISSFLDVETSKIDGLVSEQRRLIALLKEKRQAVISHAVTKGLNPNAPMKPSGIQWLGDVPRHWELKPLKYIGQIISGFAFKSHAFTDAGVRVLKIANIQTFNLDWSDESFVPESFYAQNRSFAVFDGDIVFALTRPIISSGLKAAIADVGDELVLLNQRNAIFRPTNSLDKHFFYHVLFSESFRIDFENNIDFTGQQPNISPLDIADIKIPFPPKDEQEQIGAYLDKQVDTFSQLQAEAERAIELLQERRTALISAAVTGKIDVREYAYQETT